MRHCSSDTRKQNKFSVICAHTHTQIQTGSSQYWTAPTNFSVHKSPQYTFTGSQIPLLCFCCHHKLLPKTSILAFVKACFNWYTGQWRDCTLHKMEFCEKYLFAYIILYSYLPSLQCDVTQLCSFQITWIPPQWRSKCYSQMQELSDLERNQVVNNEIASCSSSRVCNVILVLNFHKIGGFLSKFHGHTGNRIVLIIIQHEEIVLPHIRSKNWHTHSLDTPYKQYYILQRQ